MSKQANQSVSAAEIFEYLEKLGLSKTEKRAVFKIMEPHIRDRVLNDYEQIKSSKQNSCAFERVIIDLDFLFQNRTDLDDSTILLIQKTTVGDMHKILVDELSKRWAPIKSQAKTINQQIVSSR